jgi:hypothetical protein
LVSDGEPIPTVAGALGGAVAAAALQGQDSEALQEGFDDGYVRGQSDAIKRQYWLRQALERERREPARESPRTVYYRLPGPEVTEDGRKLAPHTLSVPVIE